jgi:hypothetical protein
MSDSDPAGSAQPLEFSNPGADGSAALAVPPETQERADFRLFIDGNPHKFLPVFDAMATGQKGLFACWPGLIFPTAWFLYRKLYGWAALSCLLPILVVALRVDGAFGQALAYAPSVIALTGRRIYVAGARKTIARIRDASLDETDVRETIKRAGGVSVPGAVVGGLIFLSAFVVGFLGGLHAHR